MHEYARHLIASVAAQVLPARGSSIKAAMARQFLPYCLSPVGDRFILLNREYKPLGWPPRRRGHVDYSDPMFESMLVDVDHGEVAQLERVATEAGLFFYLYGGEGAPPPWRDTEASFHYVKRLRALLESNLITREGASP